MTQSLININSIPFTPSIAPQGHYTFADSSFISPNGCSANNGGQSLRYASLYSNIMAQKLTGSPLTPVITPPTSQVHKRGYMPAQVSKYHFVVPNKPTN